MKYKGVLKPPFPINDFCIVLFTDDEQQYFTQQIINGKIVGFEQLGINKSDILYSNRTIDVRKGDSAIYSFVLDNQKQIDGTYLEIRGKLLRLLKKKYFNVNAKLVISSFFNLHRKTLQLLEESRRYFKQLGLHVDLQEEDFIQITNLQVPDPSIIKAYLEECAESISSAKSISWEDLIVLKKATVLFGSHSCDIDSFLNGIPQYQKPAIYNAISNFANGLSYFELQGLMKKNGFFNAVFSSLIRLKNVFSGLAEDYVVESEFQKPTEDLPPVEVANKKVAAMYDQIKKIKSENKKEKKLVKDYAPY
jgi:hypothetical protein